MPFTRKRRRGEKKVEMCREVDGAHPNLIQQGASPTVLVIQRQTHRRNTQLGRNLPDDCRRDILTTAVAEQPVDRSFRMGLPQSRQDQLQHLPPATHRVPIRARELIVAIPVCRVVEEGQRSELAQVGKQMVVPAVLRYACEGMYLADTSYVRGVATCNQSLPDLTGNISLGVNEPSLLRLQGIMLAPPLIFP